MNEAALQILLLLSYLAIGLISVTFPIYAISVTYLRQEKSETEKERKHRVETLKSKISELAAKLGKSELDSDQIDKLREQIDRYEAEKASIELKVGYLTARGAVVNPVVLAIIALLSAGVGIYFFYEELQGYVQGFGNVIFCVFLSSVFCFATIVSLCKTISAVEYAALRPARTVGISVVYGSGRDTEQIIQKKEAILTIGAYTFDQDLENVLLAVHFPPRIEIEIKTIGAERTDVPEGAQYPGHTLVYIEKDFLPKKTILGLAVVVNPKETGKHAIPVRVCAKGIYEVEKELTLNVIK